MKQILTAGKTGTGIYGVGAQKTTDTPEAYEEYLSTPAAKAPLHGFFAVYPLRIPNGDHITGKQPCDIDGYVSKLDPADYERIGGVFLFDHTAAEVMEVLASEEKRASAIQNIRGYLYSNAQKPYSAAVKQFHAARRDGNADMIKSAEAKKDEAKANLKYLQNVEITLLLGRRFDASRDGIIALDCDGHHPPEDFDTDAIYREVSASGTGDHILYRIANGIIPDTSGNKNKTTIDGREYELFYGPGNGLAISGMEAIANPDAPTLNMESPAGRIIDQLIHSGGLTVGRKVTLSTARAAAGVFTPPAPQPEPEQGEPARLSSFEKYIISLFEESEKWKIETDMTPEKIKAKLKNPNDASAAFLRVCDWIAIDAAIEAAYGIPYHHIATAERIRRLWETSQIYRDEYASRKHAYNDSKIKNTIEKAIILGREKYDEELRRRGRR